jgi:hypothetical protein
VTRQHAKRQKKRRAVRRKSAEQAKSVGGARPMHKLRTSVCTKLRHDFDAFCYDCQLQKKRLQLSSRCKQCRNLRKTSTSEFCAEHDVKLWREQIRSVQRRLLAQLAITNQNQPTVPGHPKLDWASFDRERNKYLRARARRGPGYPRVAR